MKKSCLIMPLSILEENSSILDDDPGTLFTYCQKFLVEVRAVFQKVSLLYYISWWQGLTAQVLFGP